MITKIDTLRGCKEKTVSTKVISSTYQVITFYSITVLKNIEIISREFSTNVKLIIKIPQNNFEEIKNMLVYITNNMIKIRII